MNLCPTCRKEIPREADSCPDCGEHGLGSADADLYETADQTRLFSDEAGVRTRRAMYRSPVASSPSYSFDSIDDARFVAGTMEQAKPFVRK